MILRALHIAGRLDISSQEQLQGESEVFRLALSPGQEVEVEDHWRYLKNIVNAISSGLLEVVEYNYSHLGEGVTHAELNETIANLPSGGGGSAMEVNVYPVESPDGIIKTFTAPDGHTYESGAIAVMLNGQTLPPGDFTEGVGFTTITLNPDVQTPQSDDAIALTYVRGDGGGGDDDKQSEFRLGFLTAYNTDYKEFTTVSGNVTSINIWDTAAKGTKFFTKTFVYSGDKVQTIVTANEISGLALTKTFVYTGDVVTNITEVIA